MGWDGAKRTMEDGAGLEAEGRAGEEPGCWRSNLRGRKGRDPGRKDWAEGGCGAVPLGLQLQGTAEDRATDCRVRALGGSPLE